MKRRMKRKMSKSKMKRKRRGGEYVLRKRIRKRNTEEEKHKQRGE